MTNTGSWTITGPDQLAADLGEAARYVDIPAPITVTTEIDGITKADVGAGQGVLGDVTRPVSALFGFRVLEDLADAVRASAPGKVYGCFGSYRVSRDASAEEVTYDALLPLLAYTLELFGSPITRIAARRASLFKPDDAWYVTIRLADEVLLTLEAMACTNPSATPEILVEITGSDQVLRAEPTRQAVTVEPLAGPPAQHPWWEIEAERLLHVIARPADGPLDPARLRRAWDAIKDAAASDNPVSMSAG